MEEKRRLLIALGSNFNQQSNMNKAEGLLRHFFGGIVFTPTVWTDPIDNPLPDKYLNRLATTMTHQSLAAVERILKEIERECGRMEVDSKQGVRSFIVQTSGMSILIPLIECHLFAAKVWIKNEKHSRMG